MSENKKPLMTNRELNTNKQGWVAFFVYVFIIALCFIAFFPSMYQQSAVLIALFDYARFTSFQYTLISLIQPFLIAVIALLSGHFFAHRVQLRSLVYELVNDKKNVSKDLINSLLPAILTGVVYAILIISFDIGFRPILPEALQGPVSQPNILQVIGNVFYGGIVEEIMLRFGLMSIILYIVSFRGKSLNKWSVMISIVLSALLFALGHYPITAQTFEMTAIIWVRMFLLNGAGGILFGWLFWRYHIEGAMISHVTLHITIALINMVLFTVGI